jgi:hypothetical protein
MRFMLRLKLIVVMAIWSALCAGLYLVIAFGEAVLEFGAGAAGSIVGQGGSASGLMDLTGDIIQWGIGLIWLIGVLGLWFVKKLLTSRETRVSNTDVAVTAANKAAPYLANNRPAGRTEITTGTSASRILSGLMARKGRNP